jgi:hypothetical protein
LEVASTLITDAGVMQFARLDRVNNLQVSGTRVTDRGIASLANMPSLEVIRLRHCKQITDRVLAPFMHSRVSTIDLSSNMQIGDGALVYLEKMPRLSLLNLEGTSVTLQGVDHLLSINTHIDGVGLSNTSFPAPKLNGLKMKFRRVNITDEVN